MRRRRRGGFMRTVGMGFLFIMGAGLLLALLRVFNWDVFGITDWLIAVFSNIIDKIANWWTGQDKFNELTNAPGALVLAPGTISLRRFRNLLTVLFRF